MTSLDAFPTTPALQPIPINYHASITPTRFSNILFSKVTEMDLCYWLETRYNHQRWSLTGLRITRIRTDYIDRLRRHTISPISHPQHIINGRLHVDICLSPGRGCVRRHRTHLFRSKQLTQTPYPIYFPLPLPIRSLIKSFRRYWMLLRETS